MVFIRKRLGVVIGVRMFVVMLVIKIYSIFFYENLYGVKEYLECILGV